MNRRLSVLLILFVIPLLSVFAAGARETASSADATAEVVISKVYSFSADRLPNQPVYEHQIVREQFGIVFDVEYVAQSAYTEKMNLYFASGNYPDYVYRAPNVADLHRWAMEGHIRPMSDLFDRLPEYFANWTPEGWAEAELFNRSPDGKLYFLPERRDYSHYMAWMYRKDLFEAAGIEFPSTTDGLLIALDRLKQLHPDRTAIINQFGIDMLWGFQLAFRTNKDVHVDIDTGELVYGPATQKYRDMLTFVHELYRRGHIDREWLTMQRSQWQQVHFRNQTPLVEFQYNNQVLAVNNEARLTNPDVTWDWYRSSITAYPDRPPMVVDWPGFGATGPFLTIGASQQKVDRMVDYFNWAFTHEGQIALNFGAPGVTMDFVDGVPRIRQEVLDRGNWNWALNNLSFVPSEFYQQIHGEIYTIRMDLAEAHRDLPTIKRVPWNWTQTEARTRADIAVVMTDTHNNFSARFVNGDLNPANDAHWQQFMNALNQGGLASFLDLHRQAYARIQW